MKILWALVLALTQLGGSAVAQFPQNQQHWVATWTTAQLLVRPQAQQESQAPRGFTNQTVRMIVRGSIGGERVRVKLASAFGSEPVVVGAAHIALRSKESGIVPGSDRVLAFDGKPGCTIGPGMVILSDPVELSVPQLADLAVSLYFPGETGPACRDSGPR